ncbi:hypothetical protein FPZ12_029615 [Amycolatopsis acidicola]|uniref:Uncharacterized protein n=1 Tax=Amycolatopsis acidicola TaxID=2596893 RepID=A0A5N0UU72_9PSEU|nr:hypothetical protein [Amycolatopsis acidicola]KAA9155556.1 hypothetical protein FPZ12_029615 [Amycolatopsis acidicola]
MAKTFTRLITKTLALAHTVYAIIWILPLHGSSQIDRPLLTQKLAESVPLWAVLFGVTAAALWFSLLRIRAATWGHGFGAIATSTYGVCSAFSAATTHPPGSFLSAAVFLTIAGVHLVAQRTYARLGV